MEVLSDKAKVYVGGIPKEASEDTLKEHFAKYGEIVKAVIGKEKVTGNPKGFGFVWFSDEGGAKTAIQDEEHVLLGTKVEVKESTTRSAIPDGPCRMCSNSNNNGNKQHGKKIFVGGLPSGLTEEEFRIFFERFGETTDVVIISDPVNRIPRGFGFITFNSEQSARDVLQNSRYLIRGKDVEVKPAVPKQPTTGTERIDPCPDRPDYTPYFDVNEWRRYIQGSSVTYPIHHPFAPPPPTYHPCPPPPPPYYYTYPWPYSYGTGYSVYNGYDGYGSHGVNPVYGGGGDQTRIKITKPPDKQEASSSSGMNGVNGSLDGQIGSSNSSEGREHQPQSL